MVKTINAGLGKCFTDMFVLTFSSLYDMHCMDTCHNSFWQKYPENKSNCMMTVFLRLPISYFVFFLII